MAGNINGFAPNSFKQETIDFTATSIFATPLLPTPIAIEAPTLIVFFISGLLISFLTAKATSLIL